MAKHQISPMSGGSGSEVTFVFDDATGEHTVEIGNDRGSPTVIVGVEYQDGTTQEWSQNSRTTRQIEYDDPQAIQPKVPVGLPVGDRPKARPKPKADPTENIVEETDAEAFDVFDPRDGTTVLRKRVRQTQRFRPIQPPDAGKETKANRIDILDENGDPTGDKTLDFKRTWRQEVY